MAPARSAPPHLSQILLDAGVVTREQVEAALARHRASGVRMGEALVESGAANEQDIGWALARQLGLTFLDLTPDALDPALIASFPDGLLRRARAVPLVRDGDAITVAFGDPTDREAVAEVARASGLEVQACVAAPSAIRTALERIAERGAASSTSVEGAHRHAAHLSHRATIAREESGAHLLAGHLRRALHEHATAIHFLPDGDELRIHHRIGGRLVSAGTGPANLVWLLLARLEALGGPAYDGSQTHARGRVTCPLGEHSLRLDVSLLMGEDGLAITLGLRPGNGVALPLDHLGLDPVDLACVRSVLDEPAGLVIVSGPPRSGCSTTLASLLDALPREGRRTLAFERAEGAPLPAATRVVLDPEGTRAGWGDLAVSQDADVVAIDDAFTGEHVSGLLSGHGSGRWLLTSTDWTDSYALLAALSARPGAARVLADRLRLVIQQRMVRFMPERGAIESPAPLRPLFEVMVVSDAMRIALRNGAPVSELRALAHVDGHRDLAQQLEALTQSGRVAPSEAARLLS